MTAHADDIPEIPSRFLAPEGWRWHEFKNAEGKKLRFGSVSPQGRPRAIVVVLPGLSEFCEKYFEIAHDLLKRDCAVWVLDWRGQGRSDRYLPSSHKRHSEGFDKDLSDLDLWVRDYVRPSCGGAPLVMLAHSMGGNIGLRYLAAHPGLFRAAAFSAPMVGIRALRHLPRVLASFLTRVFGEELGPRYVPGGRDWAADGAAARARKLLTSDPERGAVHDTWMVQEPALQVGAVTFGWLRAAYQSCLALQGPGVAEKIDIPCLLAVAGYEGLVDNREIRRLAMRMNQAKLLELPRARHEILMERDAYRDIFLGAFEALLNKAL